MIRNLGLKRYFFIFMVFALLVSCASSRNAKVVTSSILSGKSFTLINLSGDLDLKNVKIIIAFDMNSRFNGFAGVNNYFGNYEVRRGNVIVLSSIGITQMAGVPDIMSIEDEYIKLLNESSYVKYDKKILTISTVENKKLIFKENG